MRVILIMIADRVNLMRQIRDTTNKEAQKTGLQRKQATCMHHSRTSWDSISKK